MPNDISGLPVAPAPPGRPDAQPIGQSRRSDRDPASGQREAAAGDRVTLTDSGRRLQEAQRQARAGEPIDHARVASIRDALAKGDYRIDAAVIADKLIGLEKELFGNR